jgi:hypothetical protein
MPNTLAYIVLLSWPIVMIVLFRRLPIERALIWSLLGGYLLLPPVARFDPPLVPLLDKFSIPILTAFVLCWQLHGRGAVGLPKSKIARILILLYIATPVATVLTNPEPMLFAVGGIPGLSVYDSLSAALSQVITLLPFFLAYKLLATERAQHEILFGLVGAGVAYSIPMLIEVRLSPQLNVWIYGFFQHGFDQMMRYGGFRPIVFLEHALWVAFFALMAVCSAAALFRTETQEKRSRYLILSIYLGVMLVLCKSAAALIYGITLIPLILYAGTKLQIRIATILAVIVAAYPLLRSMDLIPVNAILDLARSIDTERAASLQFRIENEEMLLTHASDKPLFGWGEWGRNFVYDFETGEKSTTVDGRWIIIMGIYGYFGYLGEFGLLALPVLMLARQAFRLPANDLSPYIGPLSLIFAANLVDLLPNATLIPFTWLIGGAMIGYAEALKNRSASDPPLLPGHGFKRAAKPKPAVVARFRKAYSDIVARLQNLPLAGVSPMEIRR